MRAKADHTQGALLIETAIVLPIFILIVVFVYGLFNIVNARNQISHALIQSTESLSMDKYLNDKVHSVTGISDSESLWSGLDDAILELIRIGNDPYFSSKIEWYNAAATSGQETARKRLIGYLSGGDEDAADAKLKALGVIDGLDGIELTVTVESTDVTVTLKYTLQFWADFWGLGKIPVEQSMTARFWGGAVDSDKVDSEKTETTNSNSSYPNGGDDAKGSASGGGFDEERESDGG